MGHVETSTEFERLQTRDAERRDVRSHAERGNEKRAHRRPRKLPRTVVIALAATLAVSPFFAGLPVLHAEERNERPALIDPDGIKGSLVICGGGKLPDSVRDKFFELAGGKSARIIVIPTASGDDTVDEDGREVAEIWNSREPASVAIVHTRSADEANGSSFVEPIRKATGVWIAGGKQSQLMAVYSGTRVERELGALVERGGVIGGTSAGAACQSRVMIVRGKIHDTPGFGLIPGAIVDQHFLVRGRKTRLLEALAVHPELVGLGVDEGTALVVQGRALHCLGDSTVTVCLAAGGGCEAKEVVLKAGDDSDLTMLRRAAHDRALPPSATEKLVVPEVPNGALMMVGGGRLPAEFVQKFIDLAGGPEALIVVLPTALPAHLRDDPRLARFLTREGARNVKVLKAHRPSEVEAPEFLDVLKAARGVWFSGGRQWRFVDAYEATKAVAAFHDVLRRGGVIGGSSAGATIQGDLLVRGSPLGNVEMLASGYERGFGFLRGTAIDQHFAQRNRFNDMRGAVAAHPQILGIGLDEATALIVRGHLAEVIGRHQVHFFDRSQPIAEGEPGYVSVPAGEKYDLVARRIE